MAGDQPEAVAKLVEGINNGLTEQTLMGVTGSGKTVHHGEHHRADPAPDAGARAQ